MRIHIESKKMKILILQILVLIINIILIITNIGNNYRFWCVIGTLDIFVLSVLMVGYQKAVITPVNMFFGSFCLFQFGIPVLYAINGDYKNFYTDLFSNVTLLAAAKYSVISILVASLASTIALIGKQSRYEVSENRLERVINKNKSIVVQAAFLLFILCSVVIVPKTSMAVMKQIASGIYSTANRDVMTENALLRFVQEYFYSSALLLLCFEEKRKKRFFVKAIYALVCINMLLLADRAFGLVGLLILAFYSTFIEDKNRKNQKKQCNIWIFVIIILILLFIMAFIAAKRIGDQTSFSVFSILESILSEFGFNFTSICFVMDYVPRLDSFKFGNTYLLALLKLIPSSLDIGGLLSKSDMILGETWLYNMNNANGRSFLSFGVGFSLIAESYLNFAWFGLVAIFIIVFIVSKLLRVKRNSKWKNYILLIMFLYLMMLPRRQFATLLKSIEYAILFMGLYLLVSIKIRKVNSRKIARFHRKEID